MPIKALQRGAMFPEIGQLRKGAVKPNEKQPGKDLHYFRFTSDDPETERKFTEAFGNEPQALQVFLPLPTVDANFEAFCEEYTAGAIQHRCDGETCVGWRDSKGDWQTTAKPCPGGCKATGRLKVFIPAFQRMAFVTVLTTSKHDIINLHSSLYALEAVKGSVQGIPLVLRRVKREISTPAGGGKRARREKWLLQIEAEPQWAALQFGAMREAALLTAGREPLMLTSGNVDDEDDYASSEQIDLIERLWPQASVVADGKPQSFGQWLLSRQFSLETLPAENAVKLLDWLNRRIETLNASEADAAQTETENRAEAEQSAQAEVI